MNRYNDFEHRSYERATRGGDYSRASGSAGYATSSPNLDISDHKREERPRRIRSRRAANFQSLYPSVHNLPDIPSAAVVFSKVGRKRAPEYYMSNDATTDTTTSNDERRSTFESYHHHHQEQHPSSPNPVEEDEGAVPFDRPLVEVAPGHWVELRGSEETWAALQRGFSRKLNCFCCETSMQVIADAAMVLCPECRMICPLESEGAEGTGLGLGVKVHTLPEEEEISAASFHSEKSGISHKGKKDGELKDDTDSGHSIHCKRAPTTNLGARTSSPSRDRSESPRVVSNYR